MQGLNVTFLNSVNNYDPLHCDDANPAVYAGEGSGGVAVLHVLSGDSVIWTPLHTTGLGPQTTGPLQDGQPGLCEYKLSTCVCIYVCSHTCVSYSYPSARMRSGGYGTWLSVYEYSGNEAATVKYLVSLSPSLHLLAKLIAHFSH